MSNDYNGVMHGLQAYLSWGDEGHRTPEYCSYCWQKSKSYCDVGTGISPGIP